MLQKGTHHDQEPSIQAQFARHVMAMVNALKIVNIWLFLIQRRLWVKRQLAVYETWKQLISLNMRNILMNG